MMNSSPLPSDLIFLTEYMHCIKTLPAIHIMLYFFIWKLAVAEALLRNQLQYSSHPEVALLISLS